MPNIWVGRMTLNGQKKGNALQTKIKLRWLDFYFHALSLASISSISASDPLAAVAR